MDSIHFLSTSDLCHCICIILQAWVVLISIQWGHKGDVRSIDDFSLALSMELYYEVLENDKFCERKTFVLFCMDAAWHGPLFYGIWSNKIIRDEIQIKCIILALTKPSICFKIAILHFLCLIIKFFNYINSIKQSYEKVWKFMVMVYSNLMPL